MVVGGDHACAIGTWSGVRAALAPQQEMGLIWPNLNLIIAFDVIYIALGVIFFDYLVEE